MNNPVWFSQYPVPLLDKQQRIVAYLDSFPLPRDFRQARLALLRELQSPTLAAGMVPNPRAGRSCDATSRVGI